MADERRYLAFDLGAESGRAIAGRFDGRRMGLDILHRFPNEPVQIRGTLYWNTLGTFRELQRGLSAYAAKYGNRLDGLGTDSWGVDFGLLDRNGQLVGNPVSYRDPRTDGAPERLFKKVPRAEVYDRTGIQVMPFNTLYQLFSMVEARHPLLEVAESFLCMADLQNYFFTGEQAQEFTLATTTQMYDPRQNEWSLPTLEQAGIPTRLLPQVVAPGSVVGTLLDSIAQLCGVRSCPVIAPACHDTAAAVAAVPAEGDDWLYLSSGTWSLLGAELSEPLINQRTQELNFTNEGGVDGTTRFLKNINGLWIVQECRRAWARAGIDLDYSEITLLASEAAPFKAVINPLDDVFMSPGDMPQRIADYCRRTKQAVPETRGEFVRVALESLALSYRRVAELVQEVTGKTYRVLHIVGGGTQNKLLNQFAADATGLQVKAGPVEATAFGNCLMQAVAVGDVGSLQEARQIVRDSVSVETYEPAADRGAWEQAYARFRELDS